MVLKLKNYIGGRWVSAKTRKTFKSVNPANEKQTVAIVPRSGKKDVDAAVKAANKAFKKWRLTPAPKRGEILFKAAQLILDRKEKIGNLVVKEMGKVKSESYGDVQEAIDIGFLYAGEGRRLHGDTVPSELPNKNIRTERHPVGVFGLITPWNFPTAIPAWKLFPALVCGNTVVFKPSQFTPACAQKLIECFVDAGVPPGVLNLIHGKGSEAGDALIHHKNIQGISFTGSTAVGRLIAEAAGPTYKKYSLEMGGKNPIIVMDDAKLDLAVDGCIWAAFGTTGQRCTAASRIIVHEKVYKKFTEKFVRKVKKLKLGPGSGNVDVGPLINADAVEKVEKYVEIARKERLRKLCGGSRPQGKLKNGYFFEPTVYGNVTPKSKLFKEEIFGPVTCLIKVKSLKQAIDTANDTIYGLSSAIFTQDVNNANTAARDLQSGLVYVNTSTIGAEVQSPFGGVKCTGNGHREAGGQGGALETYSEMKVINTDFSGSIQKAQMD
ncbi:MAG: aldehyde dehydrogenase family protein [Candidatus Nanoarchaeia archaeon]